MPLTARDPATQRIVFPFRDGVTAAECRDPECAAKVTAVREVLDEDESMVRRPYWRHAVRSDSCRARRDNQDSKSDWHIDWQYTRTRREHVEFRKETATQRRVADIMTEYGFAVEVQHSHISAKTMHARENFWNGRVIWLLDGRPGHTGGIDYYQGNWRWTAPMRAVWDVMTMCAVDDGDAVHLLPPDGSHLRGTSYGDLEVVASKVVTYARQDFVDQWINSERMPIGSIKTLWLEKFGQRQRAKRRAEARKSERQSEVESERRDSRWDHCNFTGDRTQLIYETTDDDDETAPLQVARPRVASANFDMKSRCYQCSAPYQWIDGVNICPACVSRNRVRTAV